MSSDTIWMLGTIAGVLALILALAWLHDWNLRRRIRDALRERGREENAARERLAELQGWGDSYGGDPDARGCDGCG